MKKFWKLLTALALIAALSVSMCAAAFAADADTAEEDEMSEEDLLLLLQLLASSEDSEGEGEAAEEIVEAEEDGDSESEMSEEDLLLLLQLLAGSDGDEGNTESSVEMASYTLGSVSYEMPADWTVEEEDEETVSYVSPSGFAYAAVNYMESEDALEIDILNEDDLAALLEEMGGAEMFSDPVYASICGFPTLYLVMEESGISAELLLVQLDDAVFMLTFMDLTQSAGISAKNIAETIAIEGADGETDLSEIPELSAASAEGDVDLTAYTLDAVTFGIPSDWECEESDSELNFTSPTGLAVAYASVEYGDGETIDLNDPDTYDMLIEAFGGEEGISVSEYVTVCGQNAIWIVADQEGMSVNLLFVQLDDGAFCFGFADFIGTSGVTMEDLAYSISIDGADGETDLSAIY